MIAHDAAIAIMEWFHKAEDDLVGQPVITFNGEAGDVYEIKLDEHHGLCFTIDPHRGTNGIREQRFYPVSTIRMKP